MVILPPDWWRPGGSWGAIVPQLGFNRPAVEVPLDNLFYLLCYATNCLSLRDTVDVSALVGQAPMALYAHVLDTCVARLRHKPSIQWRAAAPTRDLRMLPRMEGDVLLTRPDRRILIECKYTSATDSTRTLSSAHLYQLHTYLGHLAGDGGSAPRGVLLYPRVGARLALDYQLLGQHLSVRTLDLAQRWQGIHQDLLQLVDDIAAR